MDYWKPDFLYDIAKGVGEPLRIDDRILKKELGFYARIIVVIDFAKGGLPEQILIQGKKLGSSCLSIMRIVQASVQDVVSLDMMLVCY